MPDLTPDRVLFGLETSSSPEAVVCRVPEHRGEIGPLHTTTAVIVADLARQLHDARDDIRRQERLIRNMADVLYGVWRGRVTSPSAEVALMCGYVAHPSKWPDRSVCLPEHQP